ncbi:sugar ABC transporter permease [bacterium]|nr:sugar ABC transporter permease [bacterium]
MTDMPVRKRQIAPTLLFLPAFSLLILFWCVPLIPGLGLAFRSPGPEGVWPSLINYSRLLGELTFRRNLLLSLIYVVGVVGSATPIAYVASLLMTRNIRSLKWSRSLLLIPWVVPPVVSSLIFRNMAWAEIGPLTKLYRLISGQPGLLPLQDSSWAMATIILHSFWRSVPVMTLFLAAGIATIPREFHEAAQTDGATSLQRFWHITFPLTRMHLAVGMLLITAFTLQDAETVYALTGGGPHHGTEVAAVRLFKEAFDYGQFAIAAAIGSFLLAAGLCFMLLYLASFRRAEATL